MRTLIWLVGVLVLVVGITQLMHDTSGARSVLFLAVMLWLAVGGGVASTVIFRALLGSAKLRALRDAAAEKQRKGGHGHGDDDA